jgi:DNA-binding CsgD family transcriptional regulator
MDTRRLIEALEGATALEARFLGLRAALAPPPEVALFYGFGAPRRSGDAGSVPRANRVIFDLALGDWWSAYGRDRDRRLRDPVRRAIRNTLGPVRWSQVARKERLRDCRGPIWEPVHAHGITDAVSVPLHDTVAGTYGALTLICLGRSGESRAWIEDLTGDLAAIAYLFHGGLDPATGPERQSATRLSNRERECLDLVARGMRSKQVAHVLGLSPRTVDLHIARAMRRLGAVSRVQAVSVAQAAGELCSVAASASSARPQPRA